MMGRGWRHTGPALAVLWILGSVPARGQYQPPEPPPATPESPVSTPTDQRAAPAKPGAARRLDVGVGRTGGWEPLIVVEGAHEENVGFRTPPGPDDYFGAIQASLTRWHRTARSDVDFTLNGAGFAYRELKSRNRADGSAALRISSQMTRRVRGSLYGRFSYSHSDRERGLIDSAVVLPLVRTIAGDTRGNLAWRLGERTTWSLEGGWRRINFDSDVLLDTQLWTAGTSLTQRLSQGEDLSLHVRFTRVEDGRSTRDEPGGSIGLTSRLSRSVSLELRAGAGRSETVAGVEAAPTRWTAQGGASLTASLRRGFLSLRYEHGLQPVPGLGVTQLTDLVGIGAVLPVGRSFELIANGNFALRSDPQNESARRTREADAFGGGALRLARRLRLVVGYRFRYRDTTLEGGEIRNSRGSVSLAWGPESLTGSGRLAGAQRVR